MQASDGVFRAFERGVPTRTTSVLRNRDGDWKLLHAHFSVAVPDEGAGARVGEWMEQLGEVVP